jgi:hypothetical protein
MFRKNCNSLKILIEIYLKQGQASHHIEIYLGQTVTLHIILTEIHLGQTVTLYVILTEISLGRTVRIHIILTKYI